MKAIIKPLFIGTALTTASVCFAISHASSILPTEESVENNVVVMTQIFPVNQSSGYSKQERFLQMFDRPLVRIPLDEIPVNHFNPSKKKNHLFELATIFNDKLQQFLASIKLPSLWKSAQASEDKMDQNLPKKTCKTKLGSLL